MLILWLPSSRSLLLEDKDAASSIIFFYCCLDSWTVLLFPIIVLTTVVSLYLPFALSSDRLIFTCIFWNFLGMVFHARMIDVQTSNHNSEGKNFELEI
jgi:hypothetical protein